MIRRLAVVIAWVCMFGAGSSQHRLQAQVIPSFTPAGTTRAPFTGVGSFGPIWTGSGFVGCESNTSPEPKVFVLAADGTRDDIDLDLGYSTYTTAVFGAAVRSDKAVTVIGMTRTPDAWGGAFVLFLSPDRRGQTYIRLEPYSPRAVTFAADGTIWTAGTAASINDLASEHFIRRFDPTGKQTGAYLPVRTSGLPVDLGVASDSFLVASKERVGWYMRRGPQYLELDLKGRLVGRYRGVPTTRTQHISGVALRPDGRIFVSREDRAAHKAEVFLLDRQTRAWVPVELPGWSAVRQGYVAGFDGGDLVAVSWRPGAYQPGGYQVERYRVIFPTADRR